MDIDLLDVGRLCNVIYAALVEDAGPLADRSEVRQHLDATLRRAERTVPSKGPGLRRGTMSAEQARKIAADLTAYDSQIKGGRLMENE